MRMPEGSPRPRSDGHLTIRGERLPADRLIAADIDDPATVERHARQFAAGAPYPHFAIDGLFDPALLRLVHDEFDDHSGWAERQNRFSHHFRSTAAGRLGFAARTYFALVGSARFVGYLQRVTGIDHLIPDPMLVGGGLHETRAGGGFAVHLDFDTHHFNGLANALVLITYLNEDWEESYGGALELWDEQRCVTRIPPLFGHSVLLRHSDRSYHGLPAPLTPPPGRARRSIACYYFVNQFADRVVPFRRTTRHLAERRGGARLKALVRDLTPPALWRGLVSLRHGGIPDY